MYLLSLVILYVIISFLHDWIQVVKQWYISKGHGKSTYTFSAQCRRISAFRRSPPAGATQNVTLGRKAECYRKVYVDLPGPYVK
jgi:hypothetical protein